MAWRRGAALSTCEPCGFEWKVYEVGLDEIQSLFSCTINLFYAGMTAYVAVCKAGVPLFCGDPFVGIDDDDSAKDGVDVTPPFCIA